MKNILYSKKSQIGYVTLNREKIHNAFDEQLIEELTKVFHDAKLDDDLRILIITGKGKSFSAGGDLNWMKRQAQAPRHENISDAKNLGEMLRALYHFPKPTIGLINGAAYGGGVGLTACCDIVIADENAKFCLSEVKLGLVPSVISPYVLQKIGMSRAKRYFMTGEVFSAQEAQRIGLVHEVVQTSQLTKMCEKMIKTLLLGGQEAQHISKALLYEISGQSPDSVLETTARIIAERRASAEGQEGMTAFFEKRKPKWIKV